jgi:stage V sporulation protein G
MINVTDVRLIHGDGSIKAFVDVKFTLNVGQTEGAIIIKGFSVLKGKSGVFVSLPRKASKDGRWFDILSPCDDETRRVIEDRVLEAYNGALDAAVDA